MSTANGPDRTEITTLLDAVEARRPETTSRERFDRDHEALQSVQEVDLTARVVDVCERLVSAGPTEPRARFVPVEHREPAECPDPAYPFVLTTGRSHLMISQLVAPLHAGDQVNIDLDFRNAGTIDVVAPVIAVGAPAPSAANAAPMPAMSGAHS